MYIVLRYLKNVHVESAQQRSKNCISGKFVFITLCNFCSLHKDIGKNDFPKQRTKNEFSERRKINDFPKHRKKNNFPKRRTKNDFSEQRTKNDFSERRTKNDFPKRRTKNDFPKWRKKTILLIVKKNCFGKYICSGEKF